MEEKNNSEQQKNNFVEDVIGYTPLSYSDQLRNEQKRSFAEKLKNVMKCQLKPLTIEQLRRV